MSKLRRNNLGRSDVLIAGDLEVLGDVNNPSDSKTITDLAQNTVSTQQVRGDMTNVLSNLADYTSDLKLTPLEKLGVKREWESVEQEKPFVIQQAQSRGIGASMNLYQDFENAYQNLDDYLNDPVDGVLNNMTTTTDVSQTELRAFFAAYFLRRQILMYGIEVVTNVLPMSHIGGVVCGGFCDHDWQDNKDSSGVANPGEIQIGSGTFYHPNGKDFVIAGPKWMLSNLEGVIPAGTEYYILFIGSDDSRFSFWDGATTHDYVFATYSNGQWFYGNNDTPATPFAPNENDCVVAVARRMSGADGLRSWFLPTYGGQVTDDFLYESFSTYKSGREFDYNWSPLRLHYSGEREIIGSGSDVFLRAGNNAGNDVYWGTMKSRMLIEDGALYRLTARIRKPVAGGQVYIGVECRDGDWNWVATSGANSRSSAHYIGRSGYSPGTDWELVDVYFKKNPAGTGGNNGANTNNDSYTPLLLHQSTQWISPVFICQYSAAAGVFDIDYFKIEKIAMSSMIPVNPGGPPEDVAWQLPNGLTQFFNGGWIKSIGGFFEDIVATGTITAGPGSSINWDDVTGGQAAVNNLDDDIAKRNWIYAGHWFIGTTSQGFSFVFQSVPNQQKPYMRLAVEQESLEANIRILLNGIGVVSGCGGLDGVREWKVWDLPNDYIHSDADNTIRIEHDGGAADWGNIYTVMLYFDQQAAAADGITWDSLQGRPAVAQLYNNLIDPSEWVIGTQGDQGGFLKNGGITESEIISDIGPNGEPQPIWRAHQLDTDNAGGWNNYFNLPDPNKKYRFVVFAKRTAGVGTIYLGCGQTSTEFLNGTPATNPYFFHSSSLAVFPIGKWRMIVGILHEAGYSGPVSELSGVYDLETGELIASANEYRQKAGNHSQTHRTYQFYGAAGDITDFARPRVDMITGNEPSLRQLLVESIQPGAQVNPADLSDLDAAAANLLNSTATAAEAAQATAGDKPGIFASHLKTRDEYGNLYDLNSNTYARSVDDADATGGKAVQIWRGWSGHLTLSHPDNPASGKGIFLGRHYRIYARIRLIGSMTHVHYNVYNPTQETYFPPARRRNILPELTTSYKVLDLGTWFADPSKMTDTDHVYLHFLDSGSGGTSDFANCIAIDWVWFSPVDAEDGAEVNTINANDFLGDKLTYTVTSDVTITNPALLTDGAKQITNTPYTYIAGGTHWLKLDLGSAKWVSELWQYFYNFDNRHYIYRIKISEDNTNWTYIRGSASVYVTSRQSINGYNPGGIEFPTIDRIMAKCRYIMIEANGNTINANTHWYEIEVYSTPPGEDPYVRAYNNSVEPGAQVNPADLAALDSYADSKLDNLGYNPTAATSGGSSVIRNNLMDELEYYEHSGIEYVRPAGAKAAYSSADPRFVSAVTVSGKIVMRLYSATDIEIGVVLPAFQIDKRFKYAIRIRVKANVVCASGFYFRIQEYDAQLPRGITHVSHVAAASEAGVVEDTRQVTGFRENQSIGTTWEEYIWEYTPTSTAKYASPLFLNWAGMGLAMLEVDECSIVPIPNTPLDPTDDATYPYQTANGKFKVKNDGTVYAENADISGYLRSGYGKLGSLESAVRFVGTKVFTTANTEADVYAWLSTFTWDEVSEGCIGTYGPEPIEAIMKWSNRYTLASSVSGAYANIYNAATSLIATLTITFIFDTAILSSNLQPRVSGWMDVGSSDRLFRRGYYNNLYTYLYGFVDSNAYFQAHNGDYGSVALVDGARGGYVGLSLQRRANFMSTTGTSGFTAGLYDDQANKWAMNWVNGSYMRLYHPGTGAEKMRFNSTNIVCYDDFDPSPSGSHNCGKTTAYWNSMHANYLRLREQASAPGGVADWGTIAFRSGSTYKSVRWHDSAAYRKVAALSISNNW